MAEPPDSLVARLLSFGLIGEEDVPLVLELQRVVREAPGVQIADYDILGVAQALGRAVERVAGAGADVAVRRLSELPVQEREAALEAWLATVVPIATRTFGLMCDHRARQIGQRRLTVAARTGHPSPPLTVAFVDLRGSTMFMLEHDPREVEALSDELYATGQAIAARHDVAAGKFLGDGVLLISAEPQPLLEAACATVEALGERTPLRAGAGIAHGQVIRRAGDWHGPPVNLAARLAELATADEILVDAAVPAEAGLLDDAAWRDVVPRGLPVARRVAVLTASPAT
jgi:adenylate cyclase